MTMANGRFLKAVVAIAAAAAVLTTSNAAEITSFAAKTVQAAPTQYIVAKNGTGNFTTISEAVNAASSGDTILIYPGTYEEIVDAGEKELNIVGTSRDYCILRSDSVSYLQAPLSISAGTVSNLTIYGMYTGSNKARELTQSQIDEINESLAGSDSWDRQKKYRGYAVHVDNNYSYGKTLTFDGCRILSENSHCVGVGTRGDFTITFNNCEITAMGEGGCLYMHDSPLTGVGGQANLIMKNCTLTSYLCPYIMTYESLLPEINTTLLTFQNVKASAVAFADSESYVYNNVNTFFDVETLASLTKNNLLAKAGFTTTAKNLVNYLESDKTGEYMTMLEESLATGDTTKVRATKLEEGITYIGDPEKATSKNGLFPVKHQVIAIYNSTNKAGIGWLGLDGAYLTSDSYGNTLPEMNTVSLP